METNRIKKAIAILLAVCFLVSLTASAVSAGKYTVSLKGENMKPEKEMPCEEKAYNSLNIWVGNGGIATLTEQNPTHTYPK